MPFAKTLIMKKIGEVMFLSLMWAMCAGMPSAQAQSYDKLWKKVEQAQEKSLPQTVIELADEIYRKGMSEQNAGQVLKAALCRDAYREYLTPDSLYKDLATLEQWAQKEENAVTQSVLYSLLAGRYADYAAGNRYQLAVRAELDEEMPSEDIREWSAGQFFRKVDACVQASLQGKEALLAATSNGYVPFVEQADGSGLYGHDMYHLLAKRAAEQYGRMAGFGQDSLAPWVMSGNMPRLWFEFNVRAVELPFAETSIEKGSSLTLLPTIIPADATDKTCRFSSSDVAIASVNQDGVVTGNNAGTATITVTTNDGGFTASCQVHVTIPVEQVILAEDTVTTSPYGTLTLEYTVLPEEATNQHVLFRSANEGIVMCYGSTLMGVAVGTTQVIVVSEDGHASDTCVVNVIIPIEDITLNESSITLNNATPSFQLRATLYPEDATEVPLVWTSGDESVATVNSNGLVSGHAKGSTTVTVSTPDGEHSASCYVTVSENVANEDADATTISARLEQDCFVIESAAPIHGLEIYNVAGVKMFQDGTLSSNLVSVPVQGWSNGLYLIHVTLDNGQKALLKLIK